ncbi:hypothetical protein GCM10010213_18210 [Microbacterium maritypicum]|uniref:Uncharacterized protein n=1 Tax=Microbacterium maritypicum TaxID=33918 RepID=A0A4Y4BAK2_MICMQ|nr:hypothetical protein MLI01_20320 [Microbacterium liquefaciens]GGV57190.1 hypothetical protein GCM10010213_18210 [Microbacterium liquefaciens]
MEGGFDLGSVFQRDGALVEAVEVVGHDERGDSDRGDQHDTQRDPGDLEESSGRPGGGERRVAGDRRTVLVRGAANHPGSLPGEPDVTAA